MNAGPRRVQIRSEPGVTIAILEAARACQSLGLRDDQKNRVTTAVSELARNILKYAGSGEVLIRELAEGHQTGIEIVAADRGPGIEDVEKALEDHFSSSGTLGLGLPGVKRLMDEFRVESEPGAGTRVTASLWK